MDIKRIKIGYILPIIFTILIALCICLFGGISAEATEYAPESDFTFVNGTIIKYNGLASVVNIPKTISGIPVKIIADEAFCENKSIKSVTIPNSVTSIGDNTFYGCSGLTSVVIPDSVTSIGRDAFYNCSDLKEVHITDIAAWCKIDFSFGSNPLGYAHNLYLNGRLVTYLVIPSGVTRIAWGAFEGCSGLTGATIPNSVTSIGGRAFEGCSGLTGVTIPNSVTSLGEHAFRGCTGLTNVTIPDGVTSIGGCAFEGCSGLTGVTIPNSVINIDYYAFYGCIGLTSIIIPNGVTSIGAEAFAKCAGLTSVTIPDSVTSVGESAFNDCAGLTDVTIGNNLTVINQSVFRDCYNIKSIVFKCAYSRIYERAFYGCYGLTDVYYCGNEEEWKEISIYAGNDCLKNATIHYNYILPLPDKYVVTYNANGGLGNVPSVQADKGKTVKITDIIPDKKGCVFLGWAASKYGETVYHCGDIYSGGRDIILYAVWRVVPYTETTITKMSNGIVGMVKLHDVRAYKNVYVALYKNNIFCGMQEIEYNGGDGVFFTLPSDTDADMIKIMVMDDIYGLHPAAKAETVRL